MKKKIYFIIMISFIVLLLGCSKKIEKEDNIKNITSSETIIDEPKNDYVDDNPIKIAFYYKENGKYKRLDKFESSVKELEEIGIFSIALSNDLEIEGNSFKELYQNISKEIPNFNNYKIGFNIKFTLDDGTVIDENILKPLLYANYGFCHHLYAWIYDDINTTGWHSHIEEDEYNETTVMSSIKLMWGKTASRIASDIELTVFTYDEDDFDEFNHYRGISKFTTVIERS